MVVLWAREGVPESPPCGHIGWWGEISGTSPLPAPWAQAQPPCRVPLAHGSVAWGDTSVPVHGLGLPLVTPTPRRGLASPLTSDTEGVPPTSCCTPAPRPLARQCSVAWPGAHCPKVGGFRTKCLCPPTPCTPPCAARLGRGKKKVSHYVRDSTAEPEPATPSPPQAPQTHRGPPVPHGVPPHPQSRRLPCTTHLWAQQTKNKTQTTTQSSNPPHAPSESEG